MRRQLPACAPYVMKLQIVCSLPDLFWDVLVFVDYQQQTPKHLQRAIRLNNCFSNSQPTEYFHIGFLWQHFRLFGHIWVQFTNQLHICRFYNILQRLVCVFHYWFFWCVSFRLVIGLYFFLFQLQTIKLNKINKAQWQNSDPMLHWLRATKGVKLLQKTVYKKTGITSLIPSLSLQYKTI